MMNSCQAHTPVRAASFGLSLMEAQRKTGYGFAMAAASLFFWEKRAMNEDRSTKGNDALEDLGRMIVFVIVAILVALSIFGAAP